MMATHPPLDIRIKRIDPQWNHSFAAKPSIPVSVEEGASATVSSLTQREPVQVSSRELVNRIDHLGEVSDQQVQYAGEALSSLRAEFGELYDSIHEPYSACGLAYAMLLDPQLSMQTLQWEDIKQYQHPALYKQTQWIAQQLKQLKGNQAIQLLDMALPALKMLSDRQYDQFRLQMLRLIKMDKRIELREWALFYLIDYYCRPVNLGSIKQVSLQQRKPAIAQLLSALANIGTTSDSEAKQIFSDVIGEKLGFSLRWYPLSELTIQSLMQALKQVVHLKPLEKPVFLKACIAMVQYDDIIETRELEIIHCIAQALACPLPPTLSD